MDSRDKLHCPLCSAKSVKRVSYLYSLSFDLFVPFVWHRWWKCSQVSYVERFSCFPAPDFHRCNKALSAKDQDVAPCEWYQRVYKSLCPMGWVSFRTADHSYCMFSWEVRLYLFGFFFAPNNVLDWLFPVSRICVCSVSLPSSNSETYIYLFKPLWM